MSSTRDPDDDTDVSPVRITDIADGSGEGRTKYADYTYLGAGTMVKVAHPAVSGGLELTYGTGGTYGGFDRFGRIIDQKWQNTAASAKDQFQYGYDRNSNRLYADNTQTTLKDWKYEYDNLDRLTDARRGTLDDPPSNGLVSTAYRQYWETLEALGNWKGFKVDNDGAGGAGNWELEQTRTHNKANEITDISNGAANWVDPKHDLAGNMTLAPRPGDEADANDALLMVYDAWNRLMEVWGDSDGDGVLDDPGDTLIATYTYDGQNRRIRKVVEGSPDVTYDFYYSGWQILEVRKDSDTDPYEQYVWGIRYVHSPVCRFRDGNTDGDYADTGDNTDDNLYFTNDANFNVTTLISPSTGNPVERYVYDAYGKVTIYNGDWTGTRNWTDAACKKNIVLYTGHKFDAETGMYWGCYRYYHPTLGRWTSRDLIGYHDGMSLYEYVAGSPVGNIDPSGTKIVVACSEFDKIKTYLEDKVYGYEIKPYVYQPYGVTGILEKGSGRWNVIFGSGFGGDTVENEILGREGENIIYLGGHKYWGHGSSGPKTQSMDKWMKEVSGWGGKWGGSYPVGGAKAKLLPYRNRPTYGLVN